MQELEYNILRCNNYNHPDGIGVKAVCTICNSFVCLSYMAMKEMPIPFVIVCNKCSDKPELEKPLPSSDYVRRMVFENDKKRTV